MHAKESGITVKHDAIAAALRAQIKRGDFKDRLPSRGDLKRSFRVAFKTLDKAIATLEQERIVVPRNGVGVFVHPRLRNQVVSECYFVFPGHKALTDATNESRQVSLHIFEQMLNSAHELHVEVKLLAISPLNNKEINWTLLTHLKRDDYVIFLGIQYWNVIQELAKRGCRCLVLSGQPATLGLAADGMPLMSFDVDYNEMMGRLAEYFAGRGCRHPAVVGPKAHFNRSSPPLFERLSNECRRRGIEFSTRDVAKLSMTEDSLVEFCAQAVPHSSRRASPDKPSVDGFFAMTDAAARQVRAVLDKHFPSVSRSLPVVCFDLYQTWQENDLTIDALCKPHVDMARRLMEVVCRKEPFEPKDIMFPFRLETADGENAEDGGGWNSEQDRREVAAGCVSSV